MSGRARALWSARPLLVIVLAGLAARLVAAVFSKGFGMHDDHHLVIEIAQEWVDGTLDWFERGPVIYRSFFYPGLHALLFGALESLRVTDPQAKMLVVRVLHAVYSMLTVVFGTLVAARVADDRTSRRAGLVLALFWVLPFMSVRTLIEMACVPPAMIAFYLMLAGTGGAAPGEGGPAAPAGGRGAGRRWLAAGALLAVAFTIRFQSLLFLAGVALVLLGQRRGRPLALLGAGFLIGAVLLLGIPEWIAWGVPFSSFTNYALYNFEHRDAYVIGPWHRYVVLLLLILIPPASLLLLAGVVRARRRLALIWWPTALFLVVHSIIPHKQERFILPILPFLLLLGVVGLADLGRAGGILRRRERLVAGTWAWFWAANTVLLLLLTPSYSRKNRVEAMYYLSKKEDVTCLIWESNRDRTPFHPRFYLDHRVRIYDYPAGRSAENLKWDIDRHGDPFPPYIVFHGGDGIAERVSAFERDFDAVLELEKRITPSLLDRVARRINPKRNVNQTSYVYRAGRGGAADPGPPPDPDATRPR